MTVKTQTSCKKTILSFFWGLRKTLEIDIRNLFSESDMPRR